jgi:DNA-binding transcriptional ArsR family regulator
MVINSNQLDLTFGALADTTRRGMLLQLTTGEKNVSELVEAYDISQPAISKHLGVLERAGLIERRRQGRLQMVRLKPEKAEEAAGWIHYYTQFWKQQFDAVEQYLEKAKKKTKPKRND